MLSPPPPDSRDLLPPLLSCLPTSFISPRPPPALLPLLAPVLRQRISYLSDNAGPNGWLSLLSWNSERASKLPAVVQDMDLEPHPVSGELELDDLPPVMYRRLDAETLHARLEAEQFQLSPIYLWCERDDHGGTDPGWKLAELRVMEDRDDDGVEWFDSAADANAAAQNTLLNGPSQSASFQTRRQETEKKEEPDNDDYWAAYDREPATTPGPNPAQLNSNPTTSRQLANSSSSSYYSRYGAEVQPALDSHDPDEVFPEHHEGSTLQGDSLLFAPRPSNHLDIPVSGPNRDTVGPDRLSMPRPISPTSSHNSVERLEEQAQAMSAAAASVARGSLHAADAADDNGSNGAALRAIKKHIRSDIKSLSCLAKNCGIDRSEFKELVMRELENLSLLEANERGATV